MNIIDCDERDFLAPDEKEISDEELDTINMILYVKDRYNISGGGLSQNGTALERDAMSLPTKRTNQHSGYLQSCRLYPLHPTRQNQS